MLPAPTQSDRPRPDGADIRKLTAADVPVVARTLALAFYDDPHMRWIMRDDGKRLARLEQAWAVFMRRLWLEHDGGYVHQGLGGAAVWLPPEKWSVSPLTQLRVTPAVVKAVRADVPRLLWAFNAIERKHPHGRPHWYLPVIGVAPQWQGRGFGQALLRPVLQKCDAEGLPAYLEASTARNRALYERNGFECVEEFAYARGGPPLWRMWRDPRR
jgi:GNAT superfamily N-acetyltransferase